MRATTPSIILTKSDVFLSILLLACRVLAGPLIGTHKIHGSLGTLHDRPGLLLRSLTNSMAIIFLEKLYSEPRVLMNAIRSAKPITSSGNMLSARCVSPFSKATLVDGNFKKQLRHFNFEKVST